MGKLVLYLADGTAREIRLDRERITIGRRPDNDVCLPEPPVSGAHAAVLTILADSFLEDLGSTNGTLVNGKAVTKHFLRDRDEIDIGRQILVYLADDAARPDAPPESVLRQLGAAGGAGQEPARPAPVATNGTTHGKRRSDGAVETPPPPADAIHRFVAAEIERAPGAAPEPGAEPTAASAPGATESEPAESMPSVRVLTGAQAGRTLPLAVGETLVGRAGVQVAALRRSMDEVRLVSVEGLSPPCVNGLPIPADGRRLAPGDIFEIAGATLELVVPVQPGG